MVLRRLVAAVTAIVLVAEAAVLVVHVVLGKTTENQSMSIAGSDPDVMSKATYGMGAGMGAFLLLCAACAALAALRDRAPGRFARILLISAAVTHGLLGAVAVGLFGWSVFAALMLILCLLVLTLTLYAARTGGKDAPPPLGGLTPTSL